MDMGPEWVKKMTKALKAIKGLDVHDLHYLIQRELDRQDKIKKAEMDALWKPQTMTASTVPSPKMIKNQVKKHLSL